jgi:hypothetical protein
LRAERAPEPERFFFVPIQKTGDTSLHMRTKRHFGEAGVHPDDGDRDVKMLSLRTEEMTEGMLTLVDLGRDHLDRAKEARR